MRELVAAILDMGVEYVSFERFDNGAQTSIIVKSGNNRLATKYGPDRTDDEVLDIIQHWFSELPVAGVNGR